MRNVCVCVCVCARAREGLLGNYTNAGAIGRQQYAMQMGGGLQQPLDWGNASVLSRSL